MTCHYYSHYCRYFNLNHYNQVADGAGGGLSVASHELSDWLVNAEHRGDSDGR